MDTLTLIKSVYSNDGAIFEEILKKSIESYLKNIYYISGHTLEICVKSNQ